MFAPGNLYAHETMFDRCHQGHPLHKNDNANIVYPVSIFKTAPIYPNRELNRGREGSVIVEYTITKDGGVTDIKILSSTSSAFYGFDRSIKQGKALSINNPNLEGYKKAARNNMTP